MKYIDKICDAQFIKKRIDIYRDPQDRKWTPFYYNGKPTVYHISNYGDFYNLKYDRFCVKRLDTTRHVLVNIYIDGDIYVVRANRAVMLSFHPINNPEKYVVNHLDGDPTNDFEDNLEWTTQYGNKIHALTNGLIDTNTETVVLRNQMLKEKSDRESNVHNLLISGFTPDAVHKLTGINKKIISRINNGNSSSHYTEHDIRLVGKLLCEGHTQKEVSRLTGVSFREIRRLIDGESWSYIFDEYRDRIPANKRVSEIEKDEFLKLLLEGKSFKEIIQILGLENNRRSRYIYECAREILKKMN